MTEITLRCDCSLGWRFPKGNGPDPAWCPVHGDACRWCRESDCRGGCLL